MAGTKPSTGCSCTKRWRALRFLLFLAGVSLVAYMPYKAITQYESLQSIYGQWFLQGAVVAAAGVLFTWRPAFAGRLPLVLRLGAGSAAVLWMVTGLACTPSLIASMKQSLPSGGFASFHMFAQHVFLSLGVLGMAVAPKAFASRMGERVVVPAGTEPHPAEAVSPAPSA